MGWFKKFTGKIGKGLKKAGQVVGKVAKFAAPLALGALGGSLGVPLIAKIAKPVGKALGVIGGSSTSGSSAVGALLDTALDTAGEVKDKITAQSKAAISYLAGTAAPLGASAVGDAVTGSPLQNVIDDHASPRASVGWVVGALAAALGVYLLFGRRRRR